MNDKPARESNLYWKRTASRLRSIYGDDLINDVWPDQKVRIPALRFLDWLSQRRAGTPEHLVLMSFAGHSTPPLPIIESDRDLYERAFFDVFMKWCHEFISNPGDVRPITATGYCRYAAKALENLSCYYSAIPSSFRTTSVHLPQPTNCDPTKSLGEADWIELEEVIGVDRERVALKIVRDECCAAFLEEEANFNAGQTILNGDVPDNADAEACDQIRPLLKLIVSKLRQTGNITPISLLQDPMIRRHPGGRVKLWRAAKLDVGFKTSVFRGPCLGLISPSRRMVAAAVGVLICDTGWNLQPALDLSKNPFVFQTLDKAYLASPAFIESFKKRAGHHVLANLGDMLEGYRLVQALNIWQETCELHYRAEESHYATLDASRSESTISSIDVLRRYRRVADISLGLVTNLESTRALEHPFWIHSGESGLMKADRLDFSWTKGARRQVNYRSIRKTVQLIRLDESGSATAASRSAGHLSTGVILPHYLNAPHICVQLDQSIRDFQNAIQGLLTRNFDIEYVAKLLGITEGNLLEMRQHADLAGITEALGLTKGEDLPSEHLVIQFMPTDQRLAELYLAHRALQNLRHRTKNYGKFRVKYLPMLAMVKAIGRELFKSGLGPKYKMAARMTCTDIKRGRVALPFLGE